MASLFLMAEEVGFEPTVPLGTTVFKTAAFNRSAIPPFFSTNKDNIFRSYSKIDFKTIHKESHGLRYAG